MCWLIPVDSTILWVCTDYLHRPSAAVQPDVIDAGGALLVEMALALRDHMMPRALFLEAAAQFVQFCDISDICWHLALYHAADCKSVLNASFVSYCKEAAVGHAGCLFEAEAWLVCS